MGMIQSLWILVFGIAASYIVGMPVTALAFNRKGSVLEGDELWSLAPFMGYGLITSILKLFVGIDIPVKYTALPFFLVSLVFFIGFCVRRGKQGKLRSVLPSKVFVLIVLAILCLVSFAYLRVGAKWYKGYGWWDCLFYGSQAEFLKTTPFSQLLTTAETKPYVGPVVCYFMGAHRISRGVMQAFVAAMTGMDGASTLGFISIFANLLVFHALLYATKDIPMRKWLRYAGCGFSAVIPNVVMTHLECFIPICLFTSFAIVATKLFIDFLSEPNALKSILTGMFIAAVVTTLLDGIYLLAGLAALALIAMLIARKTPFFRGFLHLLLAFGCAVVLNLPYKAGIMQELLSGGMGRRVLNYITPFAYTPRCLDWAYWGSLLENMSGLRAIACMGLTLVAIGLLVAGLFALIHLLVREHTVEGLMFCALAFSPLCFWIESETYEYAFYKMFSFAIPLISFGVWRFGDLCMDELDAAFLVEPKGRLESLLRRAAKPAVCISLCGVFVFSAANSLRKVNRIVEYQIRGHTIADSRVSYLAFVHDPAMIETCSTVESMSGKNILLIDTEESLRFGWLTYYARNNFVYSLTKEIDDTYFGDRDFARTDYENVSPDCVIVWSPGSYNMVTDAEKQDDFAAVLQTRTQVHTAAAPGEQISDERFRLYAFARSAAEAELVLSVQPTQPVGEEEQILFQDRSYSVGADGVTQLRIPLELSEGGQMVEFTGSANVTISNWTLEIGGEPA